MVTETEFNKAVGLYKDPQGSVQHTNRFLMDKKGFTFAECYDAMQQAMMDNFNTKKRTT
jgi:hypothetical protein